MSVLIYLLITLMVLSTCAVAGTVDGHWHAGIGDPTAFGWVTVIFYMAAVTCSYKKYIALKKSTDAPKFWLYLTIFLLFLGINKQLDLQTWLTSTMRENAVAHGWYANRRIVQTAFIIFLGVGMLIAMLGLRMLLAKSWQLYKLTWVGILLLCTFILMRAASFHHFDIFINTHFLGLRINVILEIGALILIITEALRPHGAQPLLNGADNAVKNYVEISAVGDRVQCPKCAYPPVAEAVPGRLFKCKNCGHKYTVSMISE
jgi:hypothetical protein